MQSQCRIREISENQPANKNTFTYMHRCFHGVAHGRARAQRFAQSVCSNLGFKLSPTASSVSAETTMEFGAEFDLAAALLAEPLEGGDGDGAAEDG